MIGELHPLVKGKKGRPRTRPVQEPKEPKPIGRPKKTPEELEEAKEARKARRIINREKKREGLPPAKIGRPRTVPIREPREPKKRGPKPKADPISKMKECYSAYYHAKLCKPTKCEVCGWMFSSRNSLLIHQANNRNCFIIRLIKHMENDEHFLPEIPETTQNYLDRNLNSTESD